MKIEADSDSMLEYPHDDMQTMGMFLFLLCQWFFSMTMITHEPLNLD